MEKFELKNEIGSRFFELLALKKLKDKELINESDYLKLKKEIENEYLFKRVRS